MMEPERRLIGYARVSTDDQDLELQRKALVKYGVNPLYIYEEKRSGSTMKRPQLTLALKSMRAEDTLVVWKLDRLGRNLMGVLEMLEGIQKLGVGFVSITESFDTTTPIGKAFLQFAAVMAELERNLISERTKAGIAAKKAAGQVWGRKSMIRDNPKRMAFLGREDRAGRLRAAGEDGKVHCIWQGGAIALHARLNEIEGEDIKNVETVRRWFRDECPGLPTIAN